MSSGDLRQASDWALNDDEFLDDYVDETNPEIAMIFDRFARKVNLSDEYLHTFSQSTLDSLIVTNYIKRMLTYTGRRFTEPFGETHSYISSTHRIQTLGLACVATKVPLPDGRFIDIYVRNDLVDDLIPETWDIYFTESPTEA